MLLTADWVVPASHSPIAQGAVRVHGSRISAVGTFEDLRSEFPGDAVHEYRGCTIVPGLVNAHTHLALTCLKGLVPPQPFHEWLTHMPRAIDALSSDDMAASATHGAILAIASGSTVVGDIAYGPEAVAIAADTGLGGTFFWEVFGIAPDELPERLHELEYPADPAQACSGRLRCGISPHAPYTSGPGLLQTTHSLAEAQQAAFAVHAAESDAEMQLLRDGTGPFEDLTRQMAPDFQVPGRGAVGYLDDLGVLEGALLIHCVKVLPVELPVLARRARGAVVCPRSNEYLHNGRAAVRRMLEAGVPVGVGTDSLASNHDMDLMEEVRAIREAEPEIPTEDLLKMATVWGAQVLGLEAQFGSLGRGKQADIVVYRVSEDDPAEALIDQAGRSTVEAVVSGGVFRVIDGGAVFAVSPIERASHMARQKAAIALEGVEPGHL
jgi:cytosine/adenosine deaminase-related metal-dependent hydrolase